MSDPLEPPSNTTKREYDGGEETKGGEEELPLEYQLEVVDMNDEDMDMLEWLVRRWIPIPKKYFWETGNGDALPWQTRAWHRFVGGGSRAVQFLDRIGKPVVAATGLTESKFEYVKNTMSERQIQISNETASKRKCQIQDSRRNLKVEEGEADVI
mmetsp:Transcript_9907/g.16457  ORF Transcript_9907/g.16457 Transcript_9907/m.16457 type:complete len:155 (+) Transcript_9907:92-556(+)|eukprot:CAMPEP_0119013224 /NCGR_PEP_ID=MMETSP1176-20130426/8197_1 /TAXON_ID=265551 /ORGANISM="Synedropsis recta cf, Strain CCMP1620" /LENGTH=154 /DNA_ID=CAMNT_0006966293 /DNA_START=70 /DNA_END=534 /DNA_ORIENTATION=+